MRKNGRQGFDAQKQSTKLPCAKDEKEALRKGRENFHFLKAQAGLKTFLCLR